MSVWVDHTFNAFLFRQRPPSPVEIKSLRRSVELNPCAGARCRVEHRWNVDPIGLAFQQQPTGRMRQHRDEGIFQRSDHALSHFRFAQIETGMNRRHDVVELRQHFIGKIE